VAKAKRPFICLDNKGYEVSLERLKIYVVLARTGVVAIPWQPSAVRAGTWIAFSILALNTVANFGSRSRIERTLMTPAAFDCSVCLLVAALSDHP
jgi:hypothetical protein